VLGAGLAAGGALLWAGLTVHDGLRAAGEVAVARLAGTVADTVVAEWERLCRSDAPPVAPSGAVFAWAGPGASPAPLEPDERWSLERPFSPPQALLAEAERLEWAEEDLAGALALVDEALAHDPDGPLAPEARLRRLHLALGLGRPAEAEADLAALRALPVAVTRDGIPYRWLAVLVLPEERRFEEAAALHPVELAGLDLDGDRIVLGSPEDPRARFELAPLVAVLLREAGLAPSAEVLRARAAEALRRLGPPLAGGGDGPGGRWHFTRRAERPFCFRTRADGGEGFFFPAGALESELARALPPDFALDFAGTEEGLGAAVRPRFALPGGEHEVTLRHAHPERLASAEAARLRLLRAALFALAAACAVGGAAMARVLSRQRRLDALKSRFIAGVSHDLRTPLASILLVAENLEGGVVGEADRPRYHRALRREAARLRHLIDDVLDFARLERGEAVRLQREDLDLAAWVEGLAADLEGRVTERGRDFRCERGSLPESAHLDGPAVRRALENLVANALAHGEGTVRLDVRAAAGRLVFVVSDEGPGVPVADRERVFEAFERGRNSAHRGGTGLGLAIVRSIARAHGGDARAGAGSAFELELPLDERPAEVEHIGGNGVVEGIA